jgi:hypothetical protein
VTVSMPGDTPGGPLDSNLWERVDLWPLVLGATVVVALLLGLVAVLLAVRANRDLSDDRSDRAGDPGAPPSDIE